MTTPKRPGITNRELDATLRAWLRPGPASLSEPATQRVLASVRATRQVPAWRAGPWMARSLQALRFAGAATVVLVTVIVLALGARGSGRPVGVGGPASVATTTPPAATTTPIPSPSPTPRATPIVSGDTLDGIVAATGATYTVRFPQLGGLADPAAAATINTFLRGQAEAAVRDFTAGIGKDPQAGPDQPATLQVDYSVASDSPDLVSLRVNSYTYASGAAHGSDVLTTFTFDPSSGRQLALADLFRPGVAYLDSLAAEARAQLKVTMASWITDTFTTQWLATGTAPTADNYAAWAITPGGLEITFGQYQVAAYAAGMPVVTIPVAHLAALIDPNGPLATLAANPLPSVTVTLGLYSGRPDPSWTLTDVQVAALVGQLAGLPAAVGSAPQGGLGYHGFSIFVQQPGRPDQTFLVYRGAVTSAGDAPGTYRADPQRTVESALLETGRSHLTATEITAVETDLTRQ
jgi:Protein of unknown function (DUF3298)/Deacetylase PdaC